MIVKQLGTVAQIAVGEQDDGSHVLKGNLGSVVSPVEAVGAGRGSHHDEGSLTVAAVQGLVKVALLGLGGLSNKFCKYSITSRVCRFPS